MGAKDKYAANFGNSIVETLWFIAYHKGSTEGWTGDVMEDLINDM